MVRSFFPYLIEVLLPKVAKILKPLKENLMPKKYVVLFSVKILTLFAVIVSIASTTRKFVKYIKV